MNIHLFSDVSFVDLAIQRFDAYYPGQNRYFVVTQGRIRSKYQFIKSSRVEQIHYASMRKLTNLVKYLGVNDRLIIHQLTVFKAVLALKLLQKVNLTTYWIFYGSGLYQYLARRNLYQLLDEGTPTGNLSGQDRWIYRLRDPLLSLLFQINFNSAMERFITRLNYFCFWNSYDYQLLKQHFETSARHKYFRYYDVNLHAIPTLNLNKTKRIVLVNNSASNSGNHLTVLKQLYAIDKDRQLAKIYAPLSYGAEAVRQQVIQYGGRKLGYCFQPILEFLPKQDYLNLLTEVSVGIFGHRRQEAGNNIYILLALGVKIFLRKQNNLLHYLRDRGYYVFEFEADLHSIQDLDPLSNEQQAYNRSMALAEFSPDLIDQVYRTLFD